MSNIPKADKNLGQHYLRDQNVIKKICNDFADEDVAIVEVGPGPAVLTEHLASHKKPIAVVEKDTRFEERLELFLEKESIIFGDCLKVDLASEIKERFSDKDIWLVSNLPYNVSVPLLTQFIQVPQIKFLTLMFQKEVALKAFDFASSKNNGGSLQFLCNNYFEVSLLINVAPGAFAPPPKVNSSVLSFKRREEPVIPLSEYNAFETFLRRLYAQKRKQVHKVMAAFYPKEQMVTALESCGLKATDRAETFNLEQVQLLYRKLHS